MSQQSKYYPTDKIRLGFEEYISSWKCCQVQYDIPVVVLSSLCQDIVRESFGFIHSQKVDDHHHIRRLSVTDRCSGAFGQPLLQEFIRQKSAFKRIAILAANEKRPRHSPTPVKMALRL